MMHIILTTKIKLDKVNFANSSLYCQYNILVGSFWWNILGGKFYGNFDLQFWWMLYFHPWNFQKYSIHWVLEAHFLSVRLFLCHVNITFEVLGSHAFRNYIWSTFYLSLFVSLSWFEFNTEWIWPTAKLWKCSDYCCKSAPVFVRWEKQSRLTTLWEV